MFFHKKGMTRIFLSIALSTLLSMVAAPGFAGLQNEPLPFSQNLRSIFLNQKLKTCLIGNFETFDPVSVESLPHTWWLRVPGPNTLRVSVEAFAVNPAEESGSILAKLFTEEGQQVGSVQVVHPTGSGASSGDTFTGTISADVTTRAATFRLEVRHGPAIVPETREARHYVLQLDAGDASDDIMLGISHGPKYFEPGFQVFHVNPDLNQPFTLNVVNADQKPGTIEIFDAGDNQDQRIFSGDWTEDELFKTFMLESAPRASLLVAIRANGHYSLDVTSGSDRGIYMDDCPPQGNVPPTVALDTFPAINFVGGEAFLGRKGVEQRHSASAADPNGGDLTFKWSFGRETTYFNTFRATDQGSVAFATPGVHRVGVRVTDSDRGSATAGLRKVVVDSFACTRGSGFWKQQFAYGDAKKIDDATLKAYLGILHITSRLFSGITLEQAQAILGTQAGSSMRAKAKAQALAAWLNFARGAIALDERFFVDNQGSTKRRKIFAEAMIEVEDILSNPDATTNELERAKDIAEAANRTDRDDPACMADPDWELITLPFEILFPFYFDCGEGEGTYLRHRFVSPFWGPSTYIVDDDGVGRSVDFTEIVDAVAATVDGDVIYVCPGTYTGDFEIPTAISVISFAGADETFIQGDTSNATTYNVSLAADVLLQGFTIHGARGIRCPEGGGVMVTNRASPVIRQNKIFNNEGCSGAGIQLGASTNATVENNIITFNRATSDGGGGIDDLGSTNAKIVNNVIAFNYAGPGTFNQGGGGIGVLGGTVDVRNNIFYCNSSSAGYNVIAFSSGSSVTVEYNNSFGNTDTTGASQNYTGGTGNINADPAFDVGPGSFGTCPPAFAVLSYQLQSGSPSIDAGDPDPAYNDVDGTRNDQGAYGGPNGDW